MKNKQNNQRAKEFLSCLGNGKSIYECESDNAEIDTIECRKCHEEFNSLKEAQDHVKKERHHIFRINGSWVELSVG